MRLIPFVLSAAVTTALVVTLNVQLPAGGGKTPRLGYFLSPQKGFWQNAEDSTIRFDADIQSGTLKGKTEVYLDERLVPHIYADNEVDAYFAEGYVHARFRLWQMEFQTHAAAGRLSEIMGAKANGTDFLAIDKYFRRFGMVYAAENTLKAIEADAFTKATCDAYTAGVNAYISSLTEDEYPLEYKLLDYKPEPWTNLKTALFMKYMAYDLTGGEEDFEYTNAKAVFTKAQFEKLYPYGQDSLSPVHPNGTVFPKPGIGLKIPANVDSLYLQYKDTVQVPAKPIVPNPNNGSNNWAVSGSKTKSGRPILCNDMHLDLNLPSLWFEIQISTPQHNVYGVSFPGAPEVVVGFNDYVTWGFTNATRDVTDYYEVKFKDSTHQQYWYNGNWQQASFRNEVIKIKGQPDDVEKIAMTVWGPVMYDQSYPDKLHTGKTYAIKWKAHDGSNELKAFYLLDRATSYEDYTKAVVYFECPGQNMAFAAKQGDIALKQQGGFPAKWKRQGDFLMPGFDSSYRWQGMIPDSENIVMHNPARGFISSANQLPFDTSYPYYQGGRYELFRGYIINRNLSSLQNITAQDMQHLQTDNYNLLAEMVRPALLKYTNTSTLNNEELKYFNLFKEWNLRNDAAENGPSVFTPWWDSLMHGVFGDELAQKVPLAWPQSSTLAEALLKDSAYEFADDITTPQRETLQDVVTAAFKKVVPVLTEAAKNKQLVWGNFKNSSVQHLLKIPALSRLHIYSGGGDHIINAYAGHNGPSWRMVVQLTDETEAYGVYPGGQSGNPGSAYYDRFIDTWVAGKYYKLAIVKKDSFQPANSKGKFSFSKS